jgi:hypothetical protein
MQKILEASFAILIFQPKQQLILAQRQIIVNLFNHLL